MRRGGGHSSAPTHHEHPQFTARRAHICTCAATQPHNHTHTHTPRQLPDGKPPKPRGRCGTTSIATAQQRPQQLASPHPQNTAVGIPPGPGADQTQPATRPATHAGTRAAPAPAAPHPRRQRWPCHPRPQAEAKGHTPVAGTQPTSACTARAPAPELNTPQQHRAPTALALAPHQHPHPHPHANRERDGRQRGRCTPPKAG